MAYDRAAVKQKGLQAITNFDLAQYLDELNPGEISYTQVLGLNLQSFSLVG